ncbi:MAG: diguanylate cyclase [Nitrospiraceae bacterium]|nr:diguanylate cyclase [Nitrospiraceae bacterium]
MLSDDTDNQPPEDLTLVMGEAVSGESSSTRRASLVVLSGWEIGREIELTDGEHVFGRSLKADTQVDSASVSREHAKVITTHEGDEVAFTVVDLQSSNGTRVNNMPITTKSLQNGDKVLMGDVLFKFVLHDEADARFYESVHRLIHYDQLTGLLTMDAFRRQLQVEMHRCAPDGPLCVAMTDLDGLKRVNDTHGHLAGRMVVREMGAMMRAAVRDQDLPALYGGDEAVILFPATPIEQAVVVAEGLRTAIEQRVFEHDAQSFQVTISQGIAQWPRDGKSVEQIIASADGALYAAKAAGRNCIRCAEAQ